MGCNCGTVRTFPPVAQQVAKAGIAAAKVAVAAAKGESIIANEETVAHRLSICRECPHVWKAPTGDFLRCQLCGCGLNGTIRRKAYLATEDCPEKKW